jgi:pimeloyl-ACP methyl ester carboxylesterase
MLQLLERSLIFKPDQIDHGALRNREHSRFRFRSQSGLDLDAAWLPQESQRAVLFLHGNRHNLTKFTDHYDLFEKLQLSCLAFDYPGYGASTGTPSEVELYRSAHAAYTHLRDSLGFSPSQILIYGFSLGGAVALELLQEHSAAALITEGTFTNSHAMARHRYPYLPITRFLPNRFTNDTRIQNVKLPCLLIHGEADAVVPLRMAHELSSLALPPKELVTVPGAEHTNSLMRGADELENSIKAFVFEHVGRT